MFGAVRLFPIAALSLALLAPAAAHAAPVLAPAPPQGQAQLVYPLTLAKNADLDFASLAAVGAGTAVIDPVSDTMTTTGGVLRLAGNPHAARFTGAAGGQSPVVIIRIPNRAVTITRVGGTETMIVDNFTLDGQSKRELAQAGAFEFKVGGTLRVSAGQAEGLYTGTFDVTIQYP